MILNELSFSTTQVLSILGLIQCVFILVHIGARSNNLRTATIPLAYFFALAGAFFLDFGYAELSPILKYYQVTQWLFWLYGPPLSVLLILQLVYSDKIISHKFLSILALPLVAWGSASFISGDQSECHLWHECPVFLDWLYLFGLIVGAISLLTIWLNRRVIHDMHREKFGRERYWLILALVAMNIGLLGIMLIGFGSDFNTAENTMIRSLIGLAFIYLTTTSLFRVYPRALQLKAATGAPIAQLSKTEQTIAIEIENLMTLDKVYQEPSYSRNDLARELDITEGALSRIINIHYQKSFPQLMNQYRLEDAKRLLKQTDATVKIIATEVGFNSLASFNRVFKTEIGLTPTEFREQKAQ